jgi:hypothetical protein
LLALCGTLGSQLFNVLGPQTDDILAGHLIDTELISISTEAVSNCSAVVTQKIATRLILAAEPELLVALKE